MIDKRVWHEEVVNQALADREYGRRELFDRLRSMPSDELINIPPESWLRLGSRLSTELLRLRLGSNGIALSAWHANGEGLQPVYRMRWRDRYAHWIHAFARVPERMPRFVTGTTAGLVSATISMVLVLGLSRVVPFVIAQIDTRVPLSVNTATWPNCARLDPYVDACVYTVRWSLTWQSASTFTGIATPVLMNLNRHLTSVDPIPPGDHLILWRARRTLQER